MGNGIAAAGPFAALPEAIVSYSPQGGGGALFIQADDLLRCPLYEGEEVANWMIAHYDIAGDFAALEMFDSPMALRPFVDGVRARRRANGGVPPEVAEVYEGSFRSTGPATPSPEQAASGAKVSPKGAAKPYPEWDYFAEVPDVVARYSPRTQVLTLQAGLAVEIAASEAVARAVGGALQRRKEPGSPRHPGGRNHPAAFPRRRPARRAAPTRQPRLIPAGRPRLPFPMPVPTRPAAAPITPPEQL